jgi:hypothetical protein
MTVEEYWAAVKALGLRGQTRGSPELDYICTTREGQAAHVADPERLTPEHREATIRLLRSRHRGYDA